MSKPKTMIKQGKAKKKKEQVLETADDFLAAGVEFEEAAGKWRAGDATKSLRFFGRAVETYDQGLQSFPQSLDLAYNKARVQLEIVTHPLLLKKLELPILSSLQDALSSHRYALNLNPDNADTLFNTAQVLTTLAEELAKGNDEATTDILRLLEEALELQGKCLNIQELNFEESEKQRETVIEQTVPQDNDNVQAPLTERNEDVETAEDQWFSVVEPVTMNTLMDTALAQLGTLTTLCSFLGSLTAVTPSPNLSWIEEFSSNLLNTKLAVFAQATDSARLQEVALAKANFLSAFLETGFHQGSIDANTYRRERDNAFKTPELLLDQYLDALIANAQSLIAFSSALADNARPPEGIHGQERWQALSAAIANLTAASKLQGIEPESLIRTHVLRGECSLLLWQLSHPPVSLQTAIENRTQLLKNAEVFFRNESRLSQDEDEKAIAGFRSSIAEGLQHIDSNQVIALLSAHERGRDWVNAKITDMIDEGLLSSDFHKIMAQPP